MGTRRQEIITGFLVFLMSFGIFFAGEAALRIIQFRKFGQIISVEKDKAYYRDEETGLRLNVPNRQLGISRINNLGFRGPDVELAKPRRTVRLAFLGSSTTFDGSSREGENWPHLVSTFIGNALSGCSTDFINAGKAGYGTQAMTKLYSHFVRETNADFVFVLPGDLSQDLDWLANRKGIDTHHRAYESPFAQYSVLLEKLEKNIRIVQLQRGAGSRKGKMLFEPKEVESRFRERLDNLVRILIADGQNVVLITTSGQIRREMSVDELIMAGNTAMYYLPYLYLPDLVDLRETYNRIIREIAELHKVILVADEDSIPGNPTYFTDSAHFTPAGSRVMAQRVVSSLQESDIAHRAFEEMGCEFLRESTSH